MSDALSQRIVDLVTAIETKQATEEQFNELHRLLNDSAEARRIYLKLTMDSTNLHWLANEEGSITQEPVDFIEGRPANERGKLVLRLALAAVVLLSCGLGLSLYNNYKLREKQFVQMEKLDQSIAVLSHSLDVVWNEDSNYYTKGQTMDPGVLSIQSGYLQIDFYSGATVILEGPARFELSSIKKGKLEYGKLRTTVPPQARGFTISINDYDVVDLGTEFALQVDPAGNSEVHVLDGEIQLEALSQNVSNSKVIKLSSGKAIALGKNGQQRELLADESSFVDAESLFNLASHKWQKKNEQWMNFSEQQIQNKDALVHFHFEKQQSWDKHLVNHGGHKVTNGAIIGGQWSEGRWPGKKALEFKGSGDRVRIDVPGTHYSLTFAAWVRVDNFGNQWLSTLMLTDTFAKGKPHWQITNEGEIVLGVGGDGNYFSHKNMIEDSDLGRWLYLVTVYDGKENTVTHYKNGELMVELPIAKKQSLGIGKGTIANWWDGKRNVRIGRDLNGAMDDFMIVKRAMRTEEIKKIYELGKPY